MTDSTAQAAPGSDFFAHPILNSPYEYRQYHWELDGTGQPTGVRKDGPRPASFVTPVSTHFL